MSASSELGLLAMLLILTLSVVGSRVSTRRIRGRAAVIVTRTLLAVAALTTVATIVVFAILLRAS